MKIIAYYIVFSFLWLVSLLPMRLLYIISDGLYYLVYYIARYRRNVVQTNLKNSFPEKSPEEIKQISKRFFRHFCDIAVETVAYITISEKSLNKRVVYKGLERVEELYKQGRPMIIGAMGHYGNWEWGGNFALHTSYKALTAYKPLENKYFDALFKRMRERFGFITVSMNETTRQMVKRTRSGEKIALVLIADQIPSWSEQLYFTDFLGQDTAVFLGPEKLSKGFDAPLFFINMMKIKRGYYEVTFTLLNEHPKDTKEYELTHLHIRFLENIIHQKPEYWLWSHRRWKHKRPETSKHQQ